MTFHIRIRYSARGNHVQARVFVGPDADHLALTGMLVLEAGREWDAFVERMALGADAEVLEDT